MDFENLGDLDRALVKRDRTSSDDSIISNKRRALDVDELFRTVCGVGPTSNNILQQRQQQELLKQLQIKLRSLAEEVDSLKKLEKDVDLLLDWRIGMRKWKDAINRDLTKLESQVKSSNTHRTESRVAEIVNNCSLEESVVKNVGDKIENGILVKVKDDIQASNTSFFKVISSALSLAAGQTQQTQQDLLQHMRAALGELSNRVSASEASSEEVKTSLLEFTTRYNSSVGAPITTQVVNGQATVEYVEEVRERMKQSLGLLTNELRTYTNNGRMAKDRLDQLEKEHRTSLQTLHARISKLVTEERFNQLEKRHQSSLNKLVTEERLDVINRSISVKLKAYPTRDELTELQSKFEVVNTANDEINVSKTITRLKTIENRVQEIDAACKSMVTLEQLNSTKSVFEAGLYKMATCFEAYATAKDVETVQKTIATSLDAKLSVFERAREAFEASTLEDIQQQKAQISELRDIIEATEARNIAAEFQRELSQVQTRLDTVTQQLSSSKEEREKLNFSVNKSTSEFHFLSESVSRLWAHKEQMEETLSELAQKTDTMTQSNDELRQELVDTMKRFYDEMLLTETTKRKEEMDELRQERHAIREEMETSINDLRHELQTEMRERKEVEASRNELRQELDVLRNELTAWRQEMETQQTSQQKVVSKPRRSSSGIEKYFGPDDDGSRHYLDLIKGCFCLPDEIPVRKVLHEDGRQLVTILRTKNYLVAENFQTMKHDGRYIIHEGIDDFKRCLKEVTSRVIWGQTSWPFV